MCGIVFVKNNSEKKASKKVFKRYRAQSKRGTQGYGAISIVNGKIKNVYRSEDEAGIRCIYKDTAPVMLFHHRTPTSTPNLEECTHPIYVSHEELDYDYYLVHNGVISNDTILKTEFEAKGYNYTTKVCSYYKTKDGFRPNGKEVFNDSESLAIDLAIAIDGNEPKTKAQGSIAFVMLQVEKENNNVTNVFFGRNDRNPLKLDRQGGNIVIASEGTGEDVIPHKLFRLNIATDEITSRDLDVGLNYKPPVHNHNTSYGGANRYPSTYVKTRDVEEQKKPQMDIVKKEKVPLMKMTFHTEDITGKDHWVDVMTKNCLIHRTAIDISIASLLTFEEWEEYQKYYKEIDSYDDITSYHKEYGIELSPEDMEHVGKEYKRLYVWMGNFTKKIQARSESRKARELLGNLF